MSKSCSLVVKGINMAYTLDDVIDHFGWGKFSWKLMAIVGLCYASDGIELTLISIITPILQCQWNLSSFQASATSSCLFLGMGIGSTYWGWLGDKYGRKKVMIISVAITCYFALLCADSPGYVWFLLLRFFVGIGTGGLVFTTTYVAEFIVRKHRGKALVSVDIFFSLGSLYSSMLAYFVINTAGWRVFLLLTSLPLPLSLLLSAWLPESVRFLLNTGEYNKIMDILHRISIENKVIMPNNISIKCRQSEQRGDIWLLWDKRYRYKVIIMAVLLTTSLNVYYISILMSTQVFQLQSLCSFNSTIDSTKDECHKSLNNSYLLNMIISFGEWPGIVLCILATDIIGRQKLVLFGYIILVACYVLLNFCISMTITTAIVLIMRSTATSLVQLNFGYAAEMLPNMVRTTALGFLSASSRWSLIVVPLLFHTFTHASLISMIFVCIVNVILCLFLPETKGQILLNT